MGIQGTYDGNIIQKHENNPGNILEKILEIWIPIGNVMEMYGLNIMRYNQRTMGIPCGKFHSPLQKMRELAGWSMIDLFKLVAPTHRRVPQPPTHGVVVPCEADGVARQERSRHPPILDLS